MAALGVVHKPGMADEMMRELSPLLADEGIDLDNLGDVDLETMNAALTRASERYNLELFTPVGLRRQQALDVLRDFTTSLAEGDIGKALNVVAVVEPEPSDDHPAIADVIGAGLGLLDTWYTENTVAVPARFAVPVWRASPRAAARSILRRARDGRAFDSLQELVVVFRGQQVFEGVALAVAALVMAVADSAGVGVQEAADELLAGRQPLNSSALAREKIDRTGNRTRRRSKPAGKKRPGVSGNPARRDLRPSDRVVLRQFDAWLRTQDEIAAPTVEEEGAALVALFTMARQLDINLGTPSGVEDMVDEFIDLGESEPDAAGTALVTLHEYVVFKRTCAEEDAEATEWDCAHELVEMALDELGSGFDFLTDVIEAANEIDPAERRKACAATRIVAMVPPLLEWIGSGRKATQTGAVRRADIQEVAAMLGVSAIGVNKLPDVPDDYPNLFEDTPPDPQQPIRVLAMGDVPLLASWWEDLKVVNVIDVASSRVRPGPAAADWLAEPLPPLDLAEMVIGMFLATRLTSDLTRVLFAEHVLALTVSRLIRGLVPDSGIEVPEMSDFDRLLELSADGILRDLEQMGLVEMDETGECTVPPLLRGTIAQGLVATMTIVDSLDEQ